MTDIAVAIVNYNTREQLHACLASVQSEAPSEIVVIDNASSDGSVDMVRAAYPSVVLCANKINAGYGAGANQAIASCTAEYVLLLNSDTRLQPGALRALSAYLDLHPRAAMVGPRLANPDGMLQASCHPFPSPLNAIFENSTLGRLIRYVPIVRDYYLPTWPHSHARVVPWVIGAALAMRRRAIEAVDGFDESFFMYFEEVDLCYRLAAVGWEVHFAPVTTVVHVGGASTTQRRTDMAIQLFASMRQFYQRHYSRRHLVQLALIVRGIVLIRWLVDTVRLRITRDADSRAILAADIVAWQRMLRALWRGQAARDRITL